MPNQMQKPAPRGIFARAALATCLLSPLACDPALADPPPKLEKTFSNGGVLRLYGQINKGFLKYDDGQVTGNYDLIDNYNSNTRIGLSYTTGLGDAWTYMGVVEIQYAPFSTNSTSLLQPSPPSSAYDLTNDNIRLIDNQFTSPTLGVFSIGQGNMVSYNTAEVDLSGTKVIARSAVQDIAGGQLLREADGTLSNVSVNDVFNSYNGIGRRVRLRYDSPSLGGISLKASFGRNLLYTSTNAAEESAVRNQNLYDMAMAYTGNAGDFTYRAEAAYSYQDAYSVNGKVTPGIEILDGSASMLHKPSGLNLTIALGQEDNGKFTGSYGFVKGGWQADLVSWGKTAFALDHYDGQDINGTGTSSASTGLSVVQNITDWNTELWASYRTYSYDTDKTDYQEARALFVGARFRF